MVRGVAALKGIFDPKGLGTHTLGLWDWLSPLQLLMLTRGMDP